jgi:hypothetical protein
MWVLLLAPLKGLWTRDSGWGFETPWGGWGIRALKGSFPMKDLDFRRMCRLIKAFGNIWRGFCKKDVRKKTFEAGMCMKTNKYMTDCPEKSRTFIS